MPTAVNSDLALDLTNVTKVYKGKVRALQGIEMKVNKGEVFGLLGPNGAGKSTLVKILMTVISPTQARGTVLGAPVGNKAMLRKVGYLPEHHRFPEYLTGGQVLDFYGAMALVPRAERRKRATALLDLVGMSAWADKKVKSYSKGMRQRVGIAQALMNNPELVVLDEPTDGVDPVGRRDIRQVLTRMRDEGRTVFINSHLLSELEMVCDRVAILVQGRVHSQGTINDLTHKRQFYEIDIAADQGVVVEQIYRDALPLGMTPPPPGPKALAARDPHERIHLGHLRTGELVALENTLLRVGTTDPLVVQPVIDALRARGIVIRSFRPVRPSLEDLFMEAVTDPTTGAALLPGAAPNQPKNGGPRP